MPEWEVSPCWSRTLVSSGGAVILILMAVGAAIGGNLLDRWGPRPVLGVKVVSFDREDRLWLACPPKAAPLTEVKLRHDVWS